MLGTLSRFACTVWFEPSLNKEFDSFLCSVVRTRFKDLIISGFGPGIVVELVSTAFSAKTSSIRDVRLFANDKGDVGGVISNSIISAS